MSVTDTPSTSSMRDDAGESFAGWFDLAALDQAFQAQTVSLPACRAFLEASHHIIADRFLSADDIETLLHARSWLIDQVLRRCWESRLGNFDGALVAVGGYGRSELLPASDIDLMVLLASTEDPATGQKLEAFLMLLWDIGLEVGHSVRTLQDCSEQAAADITVATNLMEARLLVGPPQLFRSMRERVSPAQVWPCREFFEAKLVEQQARYRRFDDAVYNLEPNVKEGPGGLRDAQMIGWVAKRHFGTDKLAELMAHGFLTENEYATLMDGQRFLWKVRFGLHHITRRREDRLLFDHQRTLATQFGYQDHDHKLAVEWFMRDYYWAIQELSRLNEMLLQLFQEIILYADDVAEPITINRRFRARKGFLEVADEGVFEHYPFALLELFLLMQQHPELKGVQAATIRLVRENRHLIDDSFRADIRARSLFMEIFRQPCGLTHELRRMNRYGVLAAYYPAFEQIVGQMQHDLFHAFTVDEHTLFVVRNLRRFSVTEFADELPSCSRIAATIPKRELLYLAGFFHDIGKGRGGNHAELGAIDARRFLGEHGLGDYDCDLVAWLVEHHLLMSQTAQRRDISDPEVINEFARQVGDRTRLDYLYLLTVADIRGTNPTLWNSWKDALLKDLHTATWRVLRRGLENPLNRDELINDIKTTALAGLQETAIDTGLLDKLWEDFPEEYFLRHNASEVMWHAQVILAPGHSEGVRIDLRAETERGGSALFIYTPVTDRLFSRTTALLSQMGLSIIDARIITTERGYALDTYLFLDAAGKPVIDSYQATELVERVEQELASDETDALAVTRPMTRRVTHFKVPTRVNFHPASTGDRTIVELFTTDYPGLLSDVAWIFHVNGAVLQNARIATFGALAEDVFYVTNSSGKPLSEDDQADLREKLVAALDADD